MAAEHAPPDGRRLALFFALEQASVTRSSRMHLVALLSVPLAVVAHWPGLVPELGRRVVWTSWLLAIGGALFALAGEWRLRREARGAL